MKFNRIMMYAVGVLFASFAMIACDDDDPEPVVEYEISLEKESDFYSVAVQPSAEAGEEINVEVSPVENVFIDEVLYNNTAAEKLSEYGYTFTMPEEDVVISVKSSSIVTVEQSSYFSGEADKEVAAVGELVTVAFTPLYAEDMVSKAVVNGSIECEPVSADLGEYVFSFEMPEGPAVVTGYLEYEYHTIERQWDEHCVISMLDCINNQGTEEEFCSQVSGKLVHFLYKWDLGYTVTCKVTGKQTGNDYTDTLFWSLASDNHLYQDCWAFTMPDEPVVISAVSKEDATYSGQAFTGAYTGYQMTLGDNRIINTNTPSMQLDLRESAAYFVTTTDENAFNFSGIYSVTDGTISYDPENCRGDYAMTGKVLANGYAFVVVDNIIDNKPDNRRFYLAGKSAFTYTCATDTEYATRFLIEADGNGTKSWYFVEKERISIKEAAVAFNSGASLSEDSEAIVSIDGKPYIKYTYTKGGAPVFQYVGQEAGTYTSDKGGTLILDGFGGGEYDGAKGTYTLEGGLVTFTDADGNETTINIDIATWTFTVVSDSTGITLDPVYSTTTAWIYVNDYRQDGIVKIGFNSDYNGNYKEGYAVIKVSYMKDGRAQEMIGSSNPFYIDEENRTVTISNVLMGTGTSGWSTTRKDVVMDISDDCKSLTFQDAYLYSTSGSLSEFLFGQEWTVVVSESAQ